MALNRRTYAPRSGRQRGIITHLFAGRHGFVPYHLMRCDLELIDSFWTTDVRFLQCGARSAPYAVGTMLPGSARNALGRRSDGQWRTFRYRRDRLVEPVQMAPFPAVGAIMKARNLSRKGVDSRGMAAGSHGGSLLK